MNGKVIFGILALAGIGVCVYYFVFKQRSNGIPPQNVNDEYLSKKVESSHEKMNDCVEEAKDKFAEDKRNVSISIQKRHEEAAKEMKESLNHIIEDTPVDKTENTETLNNMMDDLDKLMD